MGLLWYWIGINVAVGLVCDCCGIALALLWYCWNCCRSAVGLLWTCCVICCETVVLPGVAVMLLWDCRDIVVQILREYCGTAVELV